MGLRDIGHLGRDLPRLHVFYLSALYGDAALVAVVQPQQAAEQRTFSGTVGSQHRDQLPFLGSKIHPMQNFIFSVGEAHALGFYGRVAHTPPPFWCIR